VSVLTGRTIPRFPPPERKEHAMAELHRYVDEQGNVFSMTVDDARARGLKPYTPPKADDAEAKAVPAPPANKAR
jgi:hypothetical protein